MSISPEMNTMLESKMENLKRDQILRSGRSYNDFTDEFSGLLAQATEHRPILEASGFSFALMEEFNAILEKMVLVHGERVAAEGHADDAVKEYKEEMPKAKNNKKILSAVIRYLIAKTDDHEIKKMYDIVRKGHSQIDTLSDIISMTNIIRKYSEICFQVSPGGTTINEEFLEEVHQHALNLVALKGQADVVVQDMQNEVSRLNRITSLAVEAEREIKLFAEMAFYNDIEKYNQYYASSSLRARNSAKRSKKSDEEIIVN